jgi:hypothetical protein
MPVSNSTAAWAAIREEQAAKEQTEMLKVVGGVAVILGLAFFVSQMNRRRSILRAKQANITSRAMSMSI